MILQHQPEGPALCAGALRYEFTASGQPCRLCCGGIMINRLAGTSLDGGAAGLWLRLHENGAVRWAPLLGAGAALARSGHCLQFTGSVLGVQYALVLHAHGCGWLWEVRLSGSGQTVDVVYGQDVGLAAPAAVLENDLYTSQYLGHTVLQSGHGYVICSRQNLPQAGQNPYLQLGMLAGRAVAYSTDAMQFFGLEYKLTGRPAALESGLACANYQFECAYPALQSAPVRLDRPRRLAFYGYFLPHHPEAVRQAVPESRLRGLLAPFSGQRFAPVARAARRALFGAPLASKPMPPARLAALYPRRRLEEASGGELLSFFAPGHAHVVTQAKELLVERPHASILTTFIDTGRISSELLTTTCAMYGLFNGQTVIGNTNKHKLLSAPRGLLNRMKQSGMRIWAEEGGVFRQLTLPAVFEMGLNYCRWVYLTEEDEITAETFCAAHSTSLVTRVRCSSPRRFVVSCQLVMGTHEFLQPVPMRREGNTLYFTPAPGTPAAETYPGLCYELHFPAGAQVSDDRIFFEDGLPRSGTLLTLQLARCTGFSLRIHGTLDPAHAKPCPAEPRFEAERREYLRCYGRLLQGFHFKEHGERQLQILNETVFWYAHNALVHFAAPHGPEQPGGAAWGTRDVCQGPFEFFMALQQYPLVREILLTVFRHQNGLTGEWPQWFMFDRYPDEMDGCHGDVVFWPLKCVGAYLDATGDASLLEEALPFRHAPGSAPLYEHLRLAVDAIEARFLPGTALISYAGGDWDDTLQPCSPELQQCLVSSWTQALAWQVLEQLHRALPGPLAARCGRLARQVRRAFETHLVIDGVIAGFVYRLPGGSFAPMLHPRDGDTGIHLRLLPMTRSIIAGLSSPALAAASLALIEQKLHCPDGVRLMDHPAQYSGGVSRLFRRAEQAANVGREIGLQYTHAHIRYIEALCRMGRGGDAWNALFQVDPICLGETVKNALPRQSNLYFSSSDGAFADRWVYEREFDRLLQGTVPVKGGWRLYSSGPGIYLHQLVCGILGIRVRRGWLELDPVLPARETPLTFSLCVAGRPCTFIYRLRPGGGPPQVRQAGRALPFEALPRQQYRPGGVRLLLKSLGGPRPVHLTLFAGQETFSPAPKN